MITLNIANEYISSHGLCFNHSKTEIVIFGKCNLQPHTVWSLNNVTLTENDTLSYLGVKLSHCDKWAHVTNRVNASRRAFYTLQGKGFGNTSLDIDSILYVFNTAIRSVMMNGLNSIFLSNKQINKLDKVQCLFYYRLRNFAI